MLTSILSWSWIGTGLLLIVLVLLHSPKGDGMGGLAASGSSMFSSASSAEATLNRLTWTCLALFLSAAEPQKLQADAAAAAELLAVAARGNRSVSGRAVATADGQAQGCSEVVGHVGPVAPGIVRRKSEVFVQIEAAPSGPQGLQLIGRPRQQPFHQGAIERLHRASRGEAQGLRGIRPLPTAQMTLQMGRQHSAEIRVWNGVADDRETVPKGETGMSLQSGFVGGFSASDGSWCGW